MPKNRKIYAKIKAKDDFLFLQFKFSGNWTKLHLGKSILQNTSRKDELWQHTCFEAFIGNEKRYIEVNLSPQGSWNVYEFSGYREGMKPSQAEILYSQFKDTNNQLSFFYILRIPLLNQLKNRQASLTTVAEHVRGFKSYWATKHTRGKPDFHAPESFILPV